MPFTIAIVGRPNVGKSTLFNRLAKKRQALVDDQPGVTRDRRESEGFIGPHPVTLIDTAGYEARQDESLEARMQQQTERAVAMADLVLLVVDARAGVTPLDGHFAEWLRRVEPPVILVANKCEGRASDAGYLEAFSLGLGDPVAVSAEHGQGITDLFDAVLPHLEPEQDAEADGPGRDTSAAKTSPGEAPLQLAIVGRPNVGKSTLINKLIGEDRLLSGPEAGITRDAIAIDWQYRGRAIQLVDTAGLRRRARVTKKLEALSAGDTLRSIRFAEVVVLLLDAASPLEKQDLVIAAQVVEEGRALVIAVNKWDAARDRSSILRGIRHRLETSLPQVRGVALITVSALKGHNLDRLMKAIFEAHQVWNRRLPTATLNRWLEGVTQAHPPPARDGRRPRLKYMTQVKARPPSFVIFSSRAEGLPAAYRRYLENGLRDAFDLPGTPLRLQIRKGKNPYA